MVGGRWNPCAPRPPHGETSLHDLDGCCDFDETRSDESRELTHVDMDTFWAKL